MPTVTSARLSFRPLTAVGLFSLVLTLLVSALPMSAAEPIAPTEATKSFSIPAGPAETMLKTFAEQSGRSVMFATDKVKGITTNAVSGDIPVPDALDRLLAGTKLAAIPEKQTGGFAVRREATVEIAEKNDSSRPASERAAGEMKEGVLKLDTFEVMGSKLLNMDIARSRDDAQPYVIFDRGTIARSGSTDLNDFMKTRLTMNTVSLTNTQAIGTTGAISSVNLLGLGANQTLVLVDGHRASAPVSIGGPQQSDLSGIPLAAVERIEILPATASGIYGGGATGGVINVILRRDYVGAELETNYRNSFRSDTGISTVNLSAGLNLEKGRTTVLLAAHFAKTNALAVQDRDFLARARRTILANNPAYFIGAPPVSYTTNIKSADGSNLTLKNGTALNSPITFVPVGYAGTADGGAGLVANAGKFNYALAGSAQGLGGGFGLLPGAKKSSVSLTFRRKFANYLDGFVDLGWSRNDTRGPVAAGISATTIQATAPNNPFTQAILVTFPNTANSGFSMQGSEQDGLRFVGGVIARLPRDWKGEADFTWHRSHLKYLGTSFLRGTQAALIGNGSLDVLRDQNQSPIDLSPYVAPPTASSSFASTLTDISLRLGGPLGSWRGRTLRVSFLAEHRAERFGEGYFYSSGLAYFIPSRSQSVDSGYVELEVPLVAAEDRVTWAKGLTLQVAARHDAYEIHGTNGILAPGAVIVRADNRLRSSNPTIALKYEVTSGLMLRASYGTGFLPPAVTQLAPNPPSNIAAGAFVDPRRGNQPTPALQIVGIGNPNLLPEESQSTSVGAVLTPRALPGLRLSLDYVRIRKTDNIYAPSQQFVINNEALFPGRVTRGAVPPGDPFGVGPITLVDYGYVNLATAEIEAYNLALDYERVTQSLGTFSFFAAATFQPHFRTQILPSSPVLETVGITYANPLRFKGNAGVTWKHGRWTAGWNVVYFNSYLAADPSFVSSASIFLNLGRQRIPSQAYHNVFLGYRLSHFLPGTEVLVSVINAFDHEPPVDLPTTTYGYSPFGDPRLVSYSVSIKKSF